MVTEVLVPYALKLEFASGDDLEELTVFRANRTQRPVVAAGALYGFTNLIEQLTRWFRCSYYGERLQITLIRGATYFRAPAGIGDTFAHGYPPRKSFALPGGAATYPQVFRIIDGGFDSQHPAHLVVHFDRVLLDPVFNSDSFETLSQIDGHLTIKATVGAPPQEAQNIFATHSLDGMVDQGRIDLGQARSIPKHDIGGKFALPDGPVVGPEDHLAFRVKPRINPAGQRIQTALPLQAQQPIQQLLRFSQVIDLSKAILCFHEANSRFAHLSGQVFTSIETNLDGQGQPALQPHMHETEFRMLIIKIEVRALANFSNQFQPLSLIVPADAKRGAGFDTLQHTYQPLLDAISLHDLLCQLLLGLLCRRHIDKRSAFLLRYCLGMGLYLAREFQTEFAKILQQHALTTKKPIQAFGVTNRTQSSTKENAIKTCYHTDDAALMPFHKTLHGLPPADLFVQTHHAMATMERLVYRELFLLILVAALPRRVTSVFYASAVNKRSTITHHRHKGHGVTQRSEIKTPLGSGY